MSPDVRRLFGEAWAEAIRRGIDPKVPGSTEAIAQIATDMIVAELDRERLSREAEEEAIGPKF